MLRDLFDGDPRSKQELRLLIQDLTSRVADDALRLSALQDGHVKELAKVEKLRKNLETVNLDLKQELSTTKQESGELQRSLGRALSMISQLKGEAVKAQEENQREIGREITSRKSLTTKLQKQILDLASALEEANALVEKTKEQLKYTSSKSAATKWTSAELARLEHRESILSRNFSELMRRENLISKNSGAVSEKLQSSEAEVSNLKSQIASLEGILTESERNVEILKNELHAGEQRLVDFAKAMTDFQERSQAKTSAQAKPPAKAVKASPKTASKTKPPAKTGKKAPLLEGL